MSFIKKFINRCKTRFKNKNKIHPEHVTLVEDPLECIICYENKDLKKSRCCSQDICENCYKNTVERTKRCPHCRKTIINCSFPNNEEESTSICTRNPVMTRVIGFIIYCGLVVALIAIIVV